MGRMQGKVWHYTGDMDPLGYGGKWIRHIAGPRYHVVRLDNMDEACGSDNEGSPRYHADLSEVDISDTENVRQALESCGWDGFPDESDPHRGLALAEALHSYGCTAPLWQEAGGNGWALIRQGKAESRMLESDPEALDERMNTPVNALGSTAREFQRGDIESAIVRGIQAGNRNAEIVAKMHGATADDIDAIRKG